MTNRPFDTPRRGSDPTGKRESESGERDAQSGEREAESGKRDAQSGKREAESGEPRFRADGSASPIDGRRHRWWEVEHVAAMRRLLGDDTCERLAIYALPDRFVLSVIVPVYNEAGTAGDVVDRLRATGIPLQIVIVDDGSVDGTGERLARFREDDDVTLLAHERNRGKGAAIRTGIAAVRGDVVVIQDADQEYDPGDFRYLLQPIVAGEADVVYGSRYGHFRNAVSPWWHRLANGVITWLTGLAIGWRLHDAETCYKMARREHFEAVAGELREPRFGIEIELTARWARLGLRFAERPIRYRPRSYAAGKKIGARDGLRALWCVVRYAVFRG